MATIHRLISVLRTRGPKQELPNLTINYPGMASISAVPTRNAPSDAVVNPIVFLDISIGGKTVGRIKIELFADRTPRTAENFRQLCTGEHRRNGLPVGYKGAPFHRVVPQFMVQGGDFVRGDGLGVMSIYGEHFADETMERHGEAGMVAMANSGPDTNGCQFYITCAPCEFLDGKHVVFGRVIDGMNVVRLIEQVPLVASKPKLPVIISECGEM
ncbi:Peptidyl-prolyl cis-trans isomerase [Paramicrosporidium saccamoebae]|uniref:Peptidyl-prolyl cis-trans isomerase n=1 Tax=Paramicrosporidium saccamoebae TaxID=1246581 RepID=A0A2H9TP70_9FUNG|nr:Peptidyl-prolyl cis-trans isomerase [Paramicrosporidium saccamoebae]